jgi:MOSC domain-containing protein YiiM
MLDPVSAVVLCGKVQPLGTKGHSSGIVKTRTPGPWQVTGVGLIGDAQADLKNHGGPDKAIHHYPFDHYAAWRQEIDEHALLGEPGAFGENISTTGWTEDSVCVGDVIRFGGALLQVCQGRQPCWKLNVRFGRDDVAYKTQFSGRTGWYYRVLEEGEVHPGDRLSLVERPQPDWPLARLTRLLYRDKDRYGDLEAMAQLPELAPGWRTLAARRLETRKTEDWGSRLNEPGQ